MFHLILFVFGWVCQGTIAQSVMAQLSIQPDYILIVKDEPVNITCVVKSKFRLEGPGSVFTLEHTEGSSKTEFNMLTQKRVTTGSAIRLKFFSGSSSQTNNVEYGAALNVTIVPAATGQLTARCGGDSNAVKTWTVIRVMKGIPTPSKTNMTCAFAVPKGNTLLSDAVVTWQLPANSPILFNGTTSCGEYEPDKTESMVCATASLVPLGMTPTADALLQLAGRYWCHLTAYDKSIKHTSSYVDFHSKEMAVKKCQPLTGANCVADSRCAFRCVVYGWPFTSCNVDLPPGAKPGQVESICRFEDMVVDVVLDPAYDNLAGKYNISVSGTGKQAESSLVYQVRIKDKLAPLWPFLGICGEVIILCIIIFTCEKRRRMELAKQSSLENQLNNDQSVNRPGSSEARQRLMPKA